MQTTASLSTYPARRVHVVALLWWLLLQLLHTRTASGGRAVLTGRERWFNTVHLSPHLLLIFQLLLILHGLAGPRRNLRAPVCSSRLHLASKSGGRQVSSWLRWGLDLAAARVVRALAIPVESEGSGDHVAEVGINLLRSSHIRIWHQADVMSFLA